MNSKLHPVLFILCLLVLAGCPASSGTKQPARTSSAPAAKPVVSMGKVVLVASELGLGDGAFVREADAAFTELARAGRIDYQAVGSLPQPLSMAPLTQDVGLPDPLNTHPGSMTLAQAEILLDSVPECDLLVLSSPLLVDPALSRIQADQINAEQILLLDENNWAERPASPPVPVYSIQYKIKDVAFLAGVTAAASSVNGMFIVMVQKTDPDREDFLDAAFAGAEYHTNGSKVACVTVDVDEESGLVTEAEFSEAMRKITERMGPYFVVNHYIVALGRATPAIMQALTSDPINSYVVGAYADYRAIREARVLGCVLKHPGQAIELIFEQLTDFSQLAQLAPPGYFEFGYFDDAVSLTDLELYGKYNTDKDDIEDAVRNVELLIKADELDCDY